MPKEPSPRTALDLPVNREVDVAEVKTDRGLDVLTAEAKPPDQVVEPQPEVKTRAPTPKAVDPVFADPESLVPSDIALARSRILDAGVVGESRITREDLITSVSWLQDRAQWARDRAKKREPLQRLDERAIKTIEQVAKLNEYLQEGDPGKEKAYRVIIDVYHTLQAMEHELAFCGGFVAEYVPETGDISIEAAARPWVGRLGIWALGPGALDIPEQSFPSRHVRKAIQKARDKQLSTLFRTDRSQEHALEREARKRVELGKSWEDLDDDTRESLMREARIEWKNLSDEERMKRMREAIQERELRLSVRDIDPRLSSGYLSSKGYENVNIDQVRREEMKREFVKIHQLRMKIVGTLTGAEVHDHLFQRAVRMGTEETPFKLQQHYVNELKGVLAEMGKELNELSEPEAAEAKFLASLRAAEALGDITTWQLNAERQGEIASKFVLGKLKDRVDEYDKRRSKVDAEVAKAEETKEAEKLDGRIMAIAGGKKDGESVTGSYKLYEGAKDGLDDAETDFQDHYQRHLDNIESLNREIEGLNLKIADARTAPETKSAYEDQARFKARAAREHRQTADRIKKTRDKAERLKAAKRQQLIVNFDDLGVAVTEITENGQPDGEIDYLKVAKKLQEKQGEVKDLQEQVEAEKEKRKTGYTLRKEATVEVRAALERLSDPQQEVLGGHHDPRKILNEGDIREILGITNKGVLGDGRLRRLLTHYLGLEVDPRRRDESWTAIKEALKVMPAPQFSQLLMFILDNRSEAACRGNPFGEIPLEERVPPIKTIEQLTDLQALLRRDAEVTEGLNGLVERVTIDGQEYVVVVQEGEERVYQRTTAERQNVLRQLTPDERNRIEHDLCRQLGFQGLRRELYTVGSPVDLVCGDGITRQIEEKNGRLVVSEETPQLIGGPVRRRVGPLTQLLEKRPEVYLTPLVERGENYLLDLAAEEEDKIQGVNRRKGSFSLSAVGKKVAIQLSPKILVEFNLSPRAIQTSVRREGKWIRVRGNETNRARISAFDPLIELPSAERRLLRPHFEVIEIPNLAGNDYEATMNEKGDLVIHQVREVGRAPEEFPDISLLSFLNSGLSLGSLSQQEYQRIQFLVGGEYLRALHRKVQA